MASICSGVPSFKTSLVFSTVFTETPICFAMISEAFTFFKIEICYGIQKSLTAQVSSVNLFFYGKHLCFFQCCKVMNNTWNLLVSKAFPSAFSCMAVNQNVLSVIFVRTDSSIAKSFSNSGFKTMSLILSIFFSLSFCVVSVTVSFAFDKTVSNFPLIILSSISISHFIFVIVESGTEVFRSTFSSDSFF